MSSSFTIEYITEIPVTYVFGKDENGIIYDNYIISNNGIIKNIIYIKDNNGI